MNKKSLVCFLFILIYTNVIAQTFTDTLARLAALKPDTTIVNQIINVAWNNRTVELDQCISYSDIALAASRKLSYAMGEGRSLTNLGSMQDLKGNYSNALTLYFEALNIWSKNGYFRGEMMVKADIAQVYGNLKQFEKQNQFLQDALTIAQAHDDKEGLATVHSNLSIYYSSQGLFRKALASQIASSNDFKQLNKGHELATSLSNTGGYYFFLKMPDSALYFYEQARNLSLQLDDKRNLSMSMLNMAEVYTLRKDFTKAENIYAEANAISTKAGIKENLKYGYEMLAALYEQQGKTKDALATIKKYELVKDSMLNETTNKQIAELQTKYETQKKDKQILEQKFSINRRNYFLGAVISLLLLGSLLGVSYYKRYQLRQEKRLQTEIMHQQDLATRGILGAEEAERERIARELHDGVGQLMSAAKMNLSAIENEISFTDLTQKAAFEKSMMLVDESCKEVRTVSHQMMPNAILKKGLASAIREFIDKIDHRVLNVELYSEGLNERIDTNTETVLYRVVQECVNNVIKHSGANRLDISLIKDRDGVSVTIEDNGKGFDVLQKEKNGIGLQNINARIHYLKGTVEFSSSPESGTLVAIHVPA